ncbi:MAG: spore coat protein GerQ [Bacilli bacterium]
MNKQKYVLRERNDFLYNNYNPNMIPSQSTDPPYQNFQNNQGQILQNISAKYPYVENILRQNVGHRGSFYMSYSDSVEWRDKIFTGILLETGRDYLLIEDEKTKENVILLTVYLNFATFNEKIMY